MRLACSVDAGTDRFQPDPGAVVSVVSALALRLDHGIELK
jgi:hypothetical protein